MAKNSKTQSKSKSIKLDVQKVKRIKLSLWKGESQATIAKKFNQPRSTVWNIAAGKTWAEVSIKTPKLKPVAKKM